jgi:hypothetical protein
MNCCNDYGKCTNGKDCPARVTRRVRAGSEPPPDLPIDMAQPDDDMATPWGELAWGLAAILVLLALGFWLGRVTA